jgi:serine/threonine-protein kinase RsbW
MIAEAPNVRLRVSSRPENVMLVREVLAGVAEAAGLDAVTLNDIRTAVTEACNNVVLHAYERTEGPLEVEVYGTGNELEVLVRDHGTGMRPQISASQDGSSGVGLLVIQALADRVVFQGSGDQDDREAEGTEVCMFFAAPGSHRLVIAGECDQRDPVELTEAGHADELAATTAVTLAPARVASTVLPRLLSALAARARFSADRISDTQLIGDELAARARDASDAGRLSLAVIVGPRDLQLRIAPPSARGPWESVDGSTPATLGPVIERLTDDQRVAAVGAVEVLDLRIIDQR